VPLALAGSLADTLWLGFVIFLPGGFLGCLAQARRRTLWVWGTAAVLLLALAYAAAIMPRWRLMVMPCLVILVAHGMLLRRFRKLALGSALAIGLLLAIYLHLKY
jgi:CHASE2 domain-containing sensor protein